MLLRHREDTRRTVKRNLPRDDASIEEFEIKKKTNKQKKPEDSRQKPELESVELVVDRRWRGRKAFRFLYPESQT